MKTISKLDGIVRNSIVETLMLSVREDLFVGVSLRDDFNHRVDT